MGRNSFPRCLVLNEVKPRTSGGTFDLGDGQLGLFKNKPSSRGATAVPDTTQSKNEDFFFEVGTNINSSEGGATERGMRTAYFKPNEVEDITFNHAKKPTQAQLYLGYDGFDKTKNLNVGYGEEAQIHVKLTGEPVSYLGYKDGTYQASFMMKAPTASECQDACLDSPCKQLVFDLVDQIKNREVDANVKLGDLIDVHPIADCFENKASVSDATFYCLEVCDKGDDAALGKVQSQVSGSNVIRKERIGTTSKYEVIKTDNQAPDDFVDYARPVLVGCDDECPSGYTNIGDDYVYVVSVEDDGSDIDFSTLNYITDSRKADQNHGIGTYVLVTTVKLTDSDIDDLKNNYPTLKFDPDYYERQGLCILDNNPTISWEECGVCSVTHKYFAIDLDDDDCGHSRLQELRNAYPDLEVYSADSSNVGAFLSGDVNGSVDTKVNNYLKDVPTGDCRNRYFTRVTTDVLCDECHPDVWQVSDENVPQTYDFEEWFEVDFGGGSIVAVDDSGCDTGYVEGTYTVTGTTNGDGSGAEFEIDIDSSGCPTVTVLNGGVNYNVDEQVTIKAEDLGTPSGQVGSTDDLVLTITDIVEPEDNVNCNCGIMFRGKDFGLCPDRLLADEVGTIRGQTEIQVSGGEILGHQIGYTYYTGNEFPVTRVSRAFDGTGFGKDYREMEKMSYDYQLGMISGTDTGERFFKGTQSKLEVCRQYDSATVKIRRSVHAGGFGQQQEEFIRYIFVYPSTVRKDIEDYLQDALPL